MPLTLADVRKWNPEAIRDVAKALTKKGASAQEVADGLKKLPIIASWEGQAGTAAKESLGRLGLFLTSHAEQMETLNKALLKAADDVENVRGDLSAMQTNADNWYFNVNYETGAVSATDSTDESTADAHQTELEGDVAKVLATANGVDQELATALSNATGAPPTNEHTPGSLPDILDRITPHPLPPEMHPTPSEMNFTEAENFIYNEMMKNQNSPWFTAIKEAMNNGPLHPLDKVDALHAFFNLTRSNGPWDHKPQIQNLVGIHGGDGLFFQQPGSDRQVFYDMYSNIHYGFIGRAAGIPPSLLETAPNIQTPFTGVNDAADDIYVKAGISMFDRYGPNMTAAQFHTGLVDVINQLDVAQQAGGAIGQLRHGYK
ncbi:hypothetical protein KIH27_16105 [Mycobacterium sp. M1]|uniref:Bacterial toxin 44 domain-containing protein n=1 Tax=Mycolicibacter acidiphilus TaxID=2835306 RepID=A0ABS5RLC8_9MYCO|nr:polymorphic toxin type 44 domain-containing protein [Mycolicibacter acidiphilus]MBS9535112.1 hypothetical protein [Mycolicibacter acidiphilus]